MSKKENAFKKYLEQSKYVKGNKIWLELPNNRIVYVSVQARKDLKFYEVDEERFIQALKDMLALFGDIEFPFHHISVSRKSSVESPNCEDGFEITIKDQYKKEEAV